MPVLVNAFPKSGTNLVKKALGGLGLTQHPGMLIRHNPYEKLVLSKTDTNKVYDLKQIPDSQFIHSHICPRLDFQGMPFIHIYRNPRNTCLSFLRWRDKTRGTNRYHKAGLLELLWSGAYTYGPFPKAIVVFHNWVSTVDTCVCRFEDICSDGGATVRKIRDYLDLDIEESQVQSVYEGLFGNGKKIEGKEVYTDDSTWSGKWSDWQECEFWDKDVERAWEEANGPRVEEFMGYPGGIYEGRA